MNYLHFERGIHNFDLERTKIGYPVQYDDYIRYGMVIALEWVLGLRESCERKNRETKRGQR
jgi:hypothetical protein